MLSACNFKANKTLEERLIIVFIVFIVCLFVCFPHTYSIKLKSTYWTYCSFFFFVLCGEGAQKRSRKLIIEE